MMHNRCNDGVQTVENGAQSWSRTLALKQKPSDHILSAAFIEVTMMLFNFFFALLLKSKRVI